MKLFGIDGFRPSTVADRRAYDPVPADALIATEEGATYFFFPNGETDDPRPRLVILYSARDSFRPGYELTEVDFVVGENEVLEPDFFETT